MRVKISKEELEKAIFDIRIIPDFIFLEAEPVQDGGTGEKCHCSDMPWPHQHTGKFFPFKEEKCDCGGYNKFTHIEGCHSAEKKCPRCINGCFIAVDGNGNGSCQCPCHSAEKLQDCSGCTDRHSEGTHAMHTKQHPCRKGGDPDCGECFPTTDTSDNWETGIKDLFDEEMMSELLKISPDAVRRLTERIREVMERARKEGFALRMETDFEAGRAAERASLREKIGQLAQRKTNALQESYEKHVLNDLLDTLKDTH